jgi:hypothetical protein
MSAKSPEAIENRLRYMREYHYTHKKESRERQRKYKERNLELVTKRQQIAFQIKKKILSDSYLRGLMRDVEIFKGVECEPPTEIIDCYKLLIQLKRTKNERYCND